MWGLCTHHSTILIHRAQVTLYVLMLTLRERLAFAGSSEGSDIDNGASDPSNHARRKYTDHGVLVHISNEQTRMDLVQASWTDVRLLLMNRNRLAGYSKEADGGKVGSLPPMIKEPNTCQYCYQAAECVAHHATAEHGSAASSGIDPMYEYILRNTSSGHLQYLLHWNNLIDLESRAVKTTQYSISDQSVRGADATGKSSSAGLRGLQLQSIDETSDGFELVLTSGHPIATGNSNSNSRVTAAYSVSLSQSLSKGQNVHVSVERSAVGSMEVVRDRQRGRVHPPKGPNEIADIESLASGPGRGAGGYDGGGGDTVSRLFGPASESLMSLEPNVSSGIISSIFETEVRVTLSERPRRLLVLLNPINGGGKGRRFRVDKDVFSSNTSISTMRGNLLSLFLQPHNSSLYMAHLQETRKNGNGNGNGNSQQSDRNKGKGGHSTNVGQGPALAYQSSTAPPGPSSASAAADLSWHWRRLIVDLQKPVFRPPRTLSLTPPPKAGSAALSDELMLFAPLDMPLATYRAALQMLQTAMSSSADDASQSKKMLVVGTLRVFPGCNPFDLHREFKVLNSGQREAMRKILSAQDYALLLGLPGTGKTSAIALVVRAMVARQQRVLLTSYTHSAVDNLVLRLLQSGMQAREVVRIGSAQSVHPAAHALLLEAKQCSTISALASRVDAARVVASTVLAASRHAFLDQLSLDCCVMDEAGQIAQPVALGAVLLAKTLVLVGDDYQVSSF
jgi:hypothetical protein